MKLPLTPYDEWALRYWLAIGKPLVDRCSPWVAAMIEQLNPRDFHQGETLQRLLVSNMADIFKCNPNEPPPAPEVINRQTVIVPPLPAYTQLTDAQQKAAAGAGRWLDTFMQWACKRASTTPPLFLESGALWLIGLATARRACIEIGVKVYPHLYILWIATTTKYAKSTGLECVRDAAQEAFPHLLLPSLSSPEALFNNLAGKQPPNMEHLNARNQERIRQGQRFAGQRGILLDEATKMLNAGAKDYMAGMLEVLLEAYDAPAIMEKDLMKHGRLIINRAGLSILGATTPSALSTSMNYLRWETGEMARYVLLAPEKPEPYSIGQSLTAPAELVEQLKRLYNRLPEPPGDNDDGTAVTAISASMEAPAIEAFQNYRRAMFELSDDIPTGLQGNYGRMPTQALKVALQLALIDWAGQAEGNPLVIREGHWARAQEISEKWRASLHLAYQDVTRSKEERLQDEIAHQLRRSPSGLTVRDLQRSTRAPKAKDVQDAINVLIDAGMVAPLPGQTAVYQWVSRENSHAP